MKVVSDGDDDANTDVKLMNGRFNVYIPSNVPQEARDRLVIQRLAQWYRDHAVVRLRAKTKRYARVMNVDPAFVGIKNYKSRWGGCSNGGKIFYNWRIIIAPHSIVDYVVVHELCHLVHGDHSRKFWKLLETILPNYLERKEWLKVHGSGLVI